MQIFQTFESLKKSSILGSFFDDEIIVSDEPINNDKPRYLDSASIADTVNLVRKAIDKFRELNNEPK